MCTSSSDRKMLTCCHSPGGAMPGCGSPTCVTMPSAGASTTSGSVTGERSGVRSGSRKKSVTPAVSRPRASVVRGRRARAATTVGTAARAVNGRAAGSIFTGRALPLVGRSSGPSAAASIGRSCGGDRGRSTGAVGPSLDSSAMTAAVTLSDVRRRFGAVAALDGLSWEAPAGRGHRGAGTQRRRQDDGHRVRGRAAAGPTPARCACWTPTRRPPGADHRARVGRDAAERRPAQRRPADAPARAPRPLLRRAGRRRRGRARGSACPTSPARPSGGSPAGRSSASRSPPRCSADPRCSSSTSRWPASTRTAGSTSGSSSASCVTPARPIVVTTHSFEEAERLADHLVIMNAGRTVAEGAVPTSSAAGPSRTSTSA